MEATNRQDSPWSDDHPVLGVLRNRRAAGYKAGVNSGSQGNHPDSGGDDDGDGYKLGLAVEGGGMRGVVSGAMLNALDDLGYTDTFDQIYASSSGAINAAYFALRQTWFPLSIYFDDLPTRDFLDFRRLLRRTGPMNLDYVFNDVLTHRKPLDYAAIVNAPQRLHIAVTDVDEVRSLVVDEFTSADDLRAALIASSWLPLAVKGTTLFRGHRAVDGGVLLPHPFHAAVQDGCTHILSLSTKPAGAPPGNLTIGDRLVGRTLDKEQPGLGSRFLELRETYQTEDRPFLESARHATDASPAILDLAPWPGTPAVKRHEIDPSRLLDAARTAYRTLLRVLEREDAPVIPRLLAYRPGSD